MTVKELIALLSKMPPDAEVWQLWDGALRTEIEHVWLARNGVVATADSGQVCYHVDERPAEAPSEPFWHTPDQPTEP